MNVSLTPELESLVHEKVESGLYTSASEVVREALRLLNDKDTIQLQRLAELNRAIAVGAEDLKQNQVIAGEQVFAELRERRGVQSQSGIPKNSQSELPNPGESLAEALEGYIGVLNSSERHGGQVSHIAENTGEEFTKIIVEKHKAGHL